MFKKVNALLYFIFGDYYELTCYVENSEDPDQLASSEANWFNLILYVPVNNLSIISGRVFLGWTCIKQVLMCLAQGHMAVTPVSLEPKALRSWVKHSTTDPLRSLEASWSGSTLLLLFHIVEAQCVLS